MAHQEDREERRWTIYVCPKCKRHTATAGQTHAENWSVDCECHDTPPSVVPVIPEQDAEQLREAASLFMEAVDAWDFDLSDYCDGELRDEVRHSKERLRAALKEKGKLDG